MCGQGGSVWIEPVAQAPRGERGAQGAIIKGTREGVSMDV